MSTGWWFDDDPDKGELWTAYEAAAALGLKPATIRSWVNRGKLSPAEARDRMGRAQFWENELRAVAARQRSESAVASTRELPSR